MITFALLLAALPVPTSQPEPVRRALAAAAASREAAIGDWIELASIPALPGEEASRAKAFAAMLTEAGLPARVLADGNVEGVWAGTEAGPPAVIAAHLDALHEPTAASPVRRMEHELIGPGVLDDGSGLGAILAAVGALRRAGWQPRREVRVVGTVGEEVGLVGARSYVEAHPRLAAFVSVDGILGRVDHGATGIRWTRWTFTGPGGHTLLAQQVASPTMAAGRAIAALASIADTEDALLNVAELRGGQAPNAIPTEASFTMDLRSDDPEELRRLVAACDHAVKSAARSEGVRVRADVLQDLPAARLAGFESSPLVRGAADILRFVGVAPQVSARGSSDHNVALLRGIPGIAVGATTGHGAHSPVETADLEDFERGTRQVVLLIVLLGEGV